MWRRAASTDVDNLHISLQLVWGMPGMAMPEIFGMIGHGPNRDALIAGRKVHTASNLHETTGYTKLFLP